MVAATDVGLTMTTIIRSSRMLLKHRVKHIRSLWLLLAFGWLPNSAPAELRVTDDAGRVMGGHI